MLEWNVEQLHRDSSPARKSGNPGANKFHRFLHIMVSVKASELFFERAQIELVRPRRAVLAMKRPKRIRDGVDIEQSVGALVLDLLCEARMHPLSADAPVDHDMSDVQAER